MKYIQNSKNNNEASISWLMNIDKEIKKFLNNMEGNKLGFYRYSKSGDLYGEDINWGLGNAVFAVKILYALNLIEKIPKNKSDCLAKFIKSFQQKDGYFFDPLIQKKARINNFITSLKNLNFKDINGEKIKIAETRQSISALNLLKDRPNIDFNKFPTTEKDIQIYLKKLNWEKPWGAGSHFSHLLFFLQNSKIINKEKLIDFSIDWINKIQNKSDGSWYLGNPTSQQKINGAMKIITGLIATDRKKFRYSKKLIDLCLSEKNNSHACDNFNIIYVLKYSNAINNNNYRYDEIRDFCYNRLRIYREYYHPECGGFSFFRNKANDFYYGARITQGLNEPDIHGTVMFLWGISIIAQIIEINKELQLKEFIT